MQTSKVFLILAPNTVCSKSETEDKYQI